MVPPKEWMEGPGRLARWEEDEGGLGTLWCLSEDELSMCVVVMSIVLPSQCRDT